MERSPLFRAQTPLSPLGYITSPEPSLSRLEVDGRAIHYHIGDDNGDITDDKEGHSFHVQWQYGMSLEELLERLQEETGLKDVIICSRSPTNGKLTPLHLQLPPNNAAMHIVLVQESSKCKIFFSSVAAHTIAFTFHTQEIRYFDAGNN
ncbi:hypothetical protein GUJ93_ZPchr0007g4736 [Zizania palustris]|uniref:DUF569 domain-containing protein n=1 Tax=Zizania palustris TaxID=103762 RepID=A0A8J5VZC3_ZIZPA|nr:hypothetical protein GUJ93_ZPchr0007g4736 [Zizania palustris]